MRWTRYSAYLLLQTNTGKEVYQDDRISCARQEHIRLASLLYTLTGRTCSPVCFCDPVCHVTVYSRRNTMIQLTALYGHPQDTAAFDRHYQETHGPLAQKMPGLKGFTINRPTSIDPQQKSP